MPSLLFNITGLDYDFYYNILRKYDVKQDFSVCLRTDSYPADINRFRSRTGKKSSEIIY